MGGFTVAVFWRPIATGLGAEVSGAPTTIDPAVFEPAPSLDAEPALGTGLISGASVAPNGTLPNPASLQAKLDALDRAPVIGDGEQVRLAYDVVDVETGQRLASREQSTPLIPASNTKSLTMVSLLHAVDPTTTFATRVVTSRQGEITLVGGGDPMLAGEAPESTYPQVASLEDLAQHTAQALSNDGITSVRLSYDASYFEGPGWNDTWPEGYRSQVTPISALWADEGINADGARSQSPALDAAKKFRDLLAAKGVTVTGEPSEATGTEGDEIARVESPQLHTLVEQAMLRSNNSYTETLGFQLARATGHPTSFDGATAAIEEQLRELGIWSQGAVLRDASGLSRSNLVTVDMLARLNAKIHSDESLQVIYDGFPVAGVTGTLASRFTDDLSRSARGVAKAKTGTLTGVSSLAGTTVTADGRQVAFAVIVNGSPEPWLTIVWIDHVVGTITGCGC